MAARQSRLLLLGSSIHYFLVCVCDYINEPSPHRHRLTKSRKSSAREETVPISRSLFPLFFKIQFQISRYFLFFSVCLISRGVVAVAHSIRKLSTCARDCFLCVVRVVSNFMLPVCAGSSSSSAAGENCEIYWQLFFIRVCCAERSL